MIPCGRQIVGGPQRQPWGITRFVVRLVAILSIGNGVPAPRGAERARGAAK